MQDVHAMQIRLRKSCDTLKIVGRGVIVFGIWSIVKVILSSTLQWNGIYADMENTGVNETEAKLAYWTILLLLIGIDLGVRLFIGQSAIAEADGKEKGWLYLAISFLGVVFSFTAIVPAGFLFGAYSGQPLLNVCITLIVEITANITMAEMCVSAVRIRKMRRQLAELGIM